MKHLLPCFILCVTAFGCDTLEGYTDNFCLDGETVEIEGEKACVYVITETGFLDDCPPEAPFAYEVMGALVCAPNEDLNDEQVATAVIEATTNDNGSNTSGGTSNNTTPAETTPVETTPKLDVLWVIDNSGSMCEEQASIRDNAELLIQELANAGIDFRFAVITTDMDDINESGRFQNTAKSETDSMCSVTVDINACPDVASGDDPTPRVISSTDARYQTNGDLDTSLLARDFGCNTSVGVQGTGFEMGLDAAREALSPELLSSANAGFLREDAYLGIVFLTDENDCSRWYDFALTNGNACEWNRHLLTPPSEYVDFFKALKGGEDKIISTGIIAPDSGVRYEFDEMLAPSCTHYQMNDMGNEVLDDEGMPVVAGVGYSSYRYQEFIEAFPRDNSLIESICQPSLETSIINIGQLMVEKITGQ